jgi:hypothetical protein
MQNGAVYFSCGTTVLGGPVHVGMGVLIYGGISEVVKGSTREAGDDNVAELPSGQSSD